MSAKNDGNVSSIPESDSKKSSPSKDLTSMASSASKDSLLSQQNTASSPGSPGQKGDVATRQENGPSQTVSKLPDGNTSMAFTVDFNEESSGKKVSGKSLSEFVPSKMKKSFDDRKDKSISKSSVSSLSKKDSISEKDKVIFICCLD